MKATSFNDDVSVGKEEKALRAKETQLGEARKLRKQVDDNLQALINRISFLSQEELRIDKDIESARRRAAELLSRQAQKDNEIAKTAKDVLATIPSTGNRPVTGRSTLLASVDSRTSISDAIQNHRLSSSPSSSTNSSMRLSSTSSSGMAALLSAGSLTADPPPRPGSSLGRRSSFNGATSSRPGSASFGTPRRKVSSSESPPPFRDRPEGAFPERPPSRASSRPPSGRSSAISSGASTPLNASPSTSRKPPSAVGTPNGKPPKPSASPLPPKPTPRLPPPPVPLPMPLPMTTVPSRKEADETEGGGLSPASLSAQDNAAAQEGPASPGVGQVAVAGTLRKEIPPRPRLDPSFQQTTLPTSLKSPSQKSPCAVPPSPDSALKKQERQPLGGGHVLQGCGETSSSRDGTGGGGAEEGPKKGLATGEGKEGHVEKSNVNNRSYSDDNHSSFHSRSPTALGDVPPLPSPSAKGGHLLFAGGQFPASLERLRSHPAEQAGTLGDAAASAGDIAVAPGEAVAASEGLRQLSSGSPRPRPREADGPVPMAPSAAVGGATAADMNMMTIVSRGSSGGGDTTARGTSLVAAGGNLSVLSSGSGGAVLYSLGGVGVGGRGVANASMKMEGIQEFVSETPKPAMKIIRTTVAHRKQQAPSVDAQAAGGSAVAAGGTGWGAGRGADGVAMALAPVESRKLQAELRKKQQLWKVRKEFGLEATPSSDSSATVMESGAGAWGKAAS